MLACVFVSCACQSSYLCLCLQCTNHTHNHTHTRTPTHTHTHTHKHTQGLSSQLDLSAEDLATLQEYMAERKQKKQAAGEL